MIGGERVIFRYYPKYGHMLLERDSVNRCGDEEVLRGVGVDFYKKTRPTGKGFF